jgi:AmiR/NasT family two-component response regulator
VAIIHHAIGMLRSRAGLGADEAFARLRNLRQAEDCELDEAAQRLITDTFRDRTRC